jgi:hypothetical protein
LTTGELFAFQCTKIKTPLWAIWRS